jgi:hypothetical protein
MTSAEPPRVVDPTFEELMSSLRTLWLGLLVGGTVSFAAACNETRDTGAVTSRAGDRTTDAPPAEAVEERDRALVRVVNAIPGGPVTVWAGDSAAFSRVTYKSATAYRQIPDDLFDFQLRSGGKESEALAHNREKLLDGGHYTIVALPAENGQNERNLRVLDDDLKPVTSGKARVRFINGMPGDTDVDVFLSGREDPLFDGVNFKVEAGWTEFDPMSGNLVVRPDNKDTRLASLSNVKLEAGKSYTFLLTGRPGKYEVVKIEDQVAATPS